MTAREGLGLANPSGKPVVDLAAPRLRIRCCGDFIDREENRDPGRQDQKKGFDEWKGIRERPLRCKGVRAPGGRIHVFGLLAHHRMVAGLDEVSADRVPNHVIALDAA